MKGNETKGRSSGEEPLVTKGKHRYGLSLVLCCSGRRRSSLLYCSSLAMLISPDLQQRHKNKK